MDNLYDRWRKHTFAVLCGPMLILFTAGAAGASRAPPEHKPTSFNQQAAGDAPNRFRLVRFASNKNKPKTEDNEVDSEDIFGFTSGTDLPEKGQKQGEIELSGARGKQDGSYTALANSVALKYMALSDTRFAISGALAYHNIAGVTGLDDRNVLTPQSLGFEIKHRFLDRTKAPFGLALSIKPAWSRIDEVSGVPVAQFGTGVGILLDKELVSDRLFGAINLLYDVAASKILDTGEWERESSIGLGTAVSLQVRQGLFLGVEARYFRAYEGLALASFAGEALFVGPTLYAKLAKCCFVAAAWNVQAWGRENGAGGSLDLVNFERHQATFKFGFDF